MRSKLNLWNKESLHDLIEVKIRFNEFKKLYSQRDKVITCVYICYKYLSTKVDRG